MNKGKIKKVFPGGNTSQGFFSFYHNMMEPKAARVLIITGGPGFGKSTFMGWIGETMLEKGFDVDFHCSSWDNGSLDGIYIPAFKAALLAENSLHGVDPKNLGAVDETIHLEDFCDPAKIAASKEQIIETRARIERLFTIACSNLKEAKVIRDEWAGYLTESMNWSQVNKLTTGILNEIFVNVIPLPQNPAKVRRLFASAISPEGPSHYFETILQDVENLYLVQGKPGTGKNALLQKITDLAIRSGLNTEVYNQPFDPAKLDLVVIPALKTAALNNTEPIDFKPHSLKNIKLLKEVGLDTYINYRILQKYAKEVAEAKIRFRYIFNRAVEYISLAKAVHEELETYYIPAMNFEAFKAKREATLQKILAWAAEFKN